MIGQDLEGRPGGGIVPGVDKIAVLRANGLGDFLFALPALEALRSAYPWAEIVLLGRPWHVEFLQGRPGPVDRVVAVPPGAGVSQEPAPVDLAELERFFAAMRAERFDLALQLHGGGRHSNPFLLRLGARVTAGLRGPDALALDRWVPYVYFQSEVLRFLEAVSVVGASPVVLEPRVTITEADETEAAAAVPPTPEPLVAIHPGASDPRRRWPTASFAAVADALCDAGARVVLVGSGEDAELAGAVLAGMGGGAESAVDRLSLGGLAGLLSRGAVVVANDSGPLHLAEAVGTSTVGIYWCGNLFTAGPAFRLRHRPALSWRLACPTCGLDCMQATCHHRPSFVADVPTTEVVDSALELLAAAHPGPS